jgi:hypothetical protein
MNWQHLDPRLWALSRPRLAVAAFAVITAAMVYGNVIARKGGIVDDAILDERNAYRANDLYVRGKVTEGFQAQEYIPFILTFPTPISAPADLQRIRDFTVRAKRAFGTAVLSLSELPNYRDTGEELLNDPYIPAVVPADFDVEAWKRRIAEDPSVFGKFIGRDFQWAAVLRYLPANYDEIGEFRQTVEFLERRQVPWWEWLYKTDIEPGDGTGVSGWVIGRGLMDQGLMVDNFTLVGVGLALTFPLFVWSLGSVREALLGVVGVVLLGVVWARGSIGLLEWVGFDIRERITALLVYTNCIVQGVSFVLHKFESYHHADHHAETHATPVAHRWLRAMRSDDLIGATGLISIFGFATLYSFQVLSIREFGILSAIAVCYQLGLATIFMPAAHTLLRSHSAAAYAPDRHQLSRRAAAFQRGLDALAAACTRLATCRSPRGTAILWGSVTVGLVVAAALLIVVGRKLPVKMLPLDFIRGTLGERTALFLNEPNRIGFDVMSFLVEPADAASDIYDPAFLQAAVRYEAHLRQATGAREIASIIDNVRRVSTASLHKPLPATRAEARTVFNLIEADLDPTVARQLYYPRGFRLTTSDQGNDTTTIGALVDGVVWVAREHPTLRVSRFGKTGIGPQVDDYIRWGKPLNLFTSQVVVVAFCLTGVWIRNRRVRQHGRGLGLRLSPLGGGLMMSAPFLFATALMALVMMVFQAPLNAVTASITALAINASVDFSIYYAAAYQEGLAATGTHTGAIRHATTHKGRVVLEDMLLNVVCFLPLVLSRFSPIQDVGWIMMAMLPACAFGAVVIMPALFYPMLRGAAVPLPQTTRFIFTRVADLARADSVPQPAVAVSVGIPTEEERAS